MVCVVGTSVVGMLRRICALKDLERAAELAEELEEIVGRMPPGSFTQDPGMRAGDEFTDVGSPGYREQAKRVAERGGAKEYATSGEGEGAEARADTLRNRVGRHGFDGVVGCCCCGWCYPSGYGF